MTSQTKTLLWVLGGVVIVGGGTLLVLSAKKDDEKAEDQKADLPKGDQKSAPPISTVPAIAELADMAALMSMPSYVQGPDDGEGWKPKNVVDT